jgi:hypothetical protein
VKPSWSIRRRVIWLSLTGGFAMVALGAVGLFQDKVTGELITGGVALVTLVASAYIGFATVDDKWHHINNMEEIDEPME